MKKLMFLMFFAVSTLVSRIASSDEEENVQFGMDASSAYVWRGITVVDGVALQPSTEITFHGLHILTRGCIDVENSGISDDEGMLLEGDMDLGYEIKSDPSTFKIGYCEYLKGKINGAEEEIYGSFNSYLNDYLSWGTIIFYETGELQDFYAQGRIACDFFLGDYLDGKITGSAGIMGDDTSTGDNGGLHDYLLGIEIFHKEDNDWTKIGGKLSYTGSLDTNVLPEQPVDLFLSVFAMYSF